eukprot:648411-Ditylum_brightwellii.AAC.1
MNATQDHGQLNGVRTSSRMAQLKTLARCIYYWNAHEGELTFGHDVTVNGELYICDPDKPAYCPEINQALYWAVVSNKSIGDVYTSVTNPNGKTANVERYRLH